jgi:hypothetical protein
MKCPIDFLNHPEISLVMGNEKLEIIFYFSLFQHDARSVTAESADVRDFQKADERGYD